MTWSDVYEFATAETTVKTFQWLAMLVTGGTGTVAVQWLYSLVFGSGEQVKRILKAVSGERDLKREEVNFSSGTCGAVEVATIPLHRIEGTNIHVNADAKLPRRPWWGKADEATGVIYHDRVDQSGLYPAGN